MQYDLAPAAPEEPVLTLSLFNPGIIYAGLLSACIDYMHVCLHIHPDMHVSTHTKPLKLTALPPAVRAGRQSQQQGLGVTRGARLRSYAIAIPSGMI